MNTKRMLLLAVILFSCKKNDLGTPSLPLLTKTISVSGSDTLTTNFAYAGGKVSFMLVAGMSSGKPVSNETRFVRHPSGILQKIIMRNPAYLATFKSDSIVYKVNYETTSNRYTSLVNQLFFLNGNVEYDST